MDTQERDELLAALGGLHAKLLDAHAYLIDNPQHPVYIAMLDAERELISIVRWVDPEVRSYGLHRIQRLP